MAKRWDPAQAGRALGKTLDMIPAAVAWTSRMTGDRTRGWSQAVTFTPNLRASLRVLWRVAGLALIDVPFVAPIGGWMRVALPVLGLFPVASGATGWWLTCALLGSSWKK